MGSSAFATYMLLAVPSWWKRFDSVPWAIVWLSSIIVVQQSSTTLSLVTPTVTSKVVAASPRLGAYSSWVLNCGAVGTSEQTHVAVGLRSDLEALHE